MAELFNNQPGVVGVLVTDSGDDNPFRLIIEDFPENGAQQGVILTELAVQRHGNFQFLHTLKDLVYVYSFGERIGQVRASGLAFTRRCTGSEGLTAVLEYYESHRLEARAKPISILIGISDAGRFRGFLTELNASVARPEARIAQFGLQFHALPSAKPSKDASAFEETPATGGGLGGSGGTQSPGGFF